MRGKAKGGKGRKGSKKGKGGKSPPSRFPELDLARGIALVFMAVYHGFFVCDFIGLAKVDVYSGFFWIFARSIAVSFIFIAGISLTIARSRLGDELACPRLIKAFLLRGGKIFAAGLIVSAVTFFAVKAERFVGFGILHLIGFCIMTAWPLARKPLVSLLLGAAFLGLGLWLGNYRFDFPWLFWLGARLPPETYAPIDYVPILPWASWFLFGIACGNALYPKGTQRRDFPALNTSAPARPLLFLGRHSLPVYLVHLPIVFGALYLIKIILGK